MFALGLGMMLSAVAVSAMMAPSGRNELDYEFRHSTGGIGQNDLQIPDFVGFHIPFAFAIAASRRQRAVLWQPAYREDAPGGHSISTVERNRQGDLLAGCRFQQDR